MFPISKATVLEETISPDVSEFLDSVYVRTRYMLVCFLDLHRALVLRENIA